MLIGVIASVTWAGAIAQALPSGWRLPTKADMFVDDERVGLPSLKAEADFNGDGRDDQALVLIRQADANGAGLFVFLARAGQPAVIQELEQYPMSAGEFVFSAVDKGCYVILGKTVCLDNPGLLRMEIEYGWRTLYWMEKNEWRHIAFGRGESNEL